MNGLVHGDPARAARLKVVDVERRSPTAQRLGDGLFISPIKALVGGGGGRGGGGINALPDVDDGGVHRGQSEVGDSPSGWCGNRAPTRLYSPNDQDAGGQSRCFRSRGRLPRQRLPAPLIVGSPAWIWTRVPSGVTPGVLPLDDRGPSLGRLGATTARTPSPLGGGPAYSSSPRTPAVECTGLATLLVIAASI